jgi:hypothetical protein
MFLNERRAVNRLSSVCPNLYALALGRLPCFTFPCGEGGKACSEKYRSVICVVLSWYLCYDHAPLLIVLTPGGYTSFYKVQTRVYIAPRSAVGVVCAWASLAFVRNTVQNMAEVCLLQASTTPCWGLKACAIPVLHINKATSTAVLFMSTSSTLHLLAC